jgi:type VI secretion system protein
MTMYEESLLERIRRLESPVEKGRTPNLSHRVGSILHHLRRMLNTRQGSVPIAEDFGMPDITNFPGDDLLSTARDLERVLIAAIQKYEPRVQKVRIRFEPPSGDGVQLRFRLEAEMIDSRDRGRTIPIIFETVVSPNGLIEVEI